MEHRLAVTTSWAFFGAFAFCFVVDGFAYGNLAPGLFGFFLFIVAFVTHVIINWVYRKDFTAGQAALGFIVFVVAALSFIGSWMFDTHFGSVNLTLGLAGFGALQWEGIGWTVLFILLAPLIGLVVGLVVMSAIFWKFRDATPSRVDPAGPIASNVRRPRRNVSNCSNNAPKSISGSIMIQSASPFGPAMYPSRLIATA